MMQTIAKTVTFDEFAAWIPENSIRRYELHNGVIVEMPLGTGDRSDVTGFISLKLAVEIDRRELPYSIPVDGEYQVKQFRESQRVESLAFPELNLRVEEIFRAG